jgi:hypothetical protein
VFWNTCLNIVNIDKYQHIRNIPILWDQHIFLIGQKTNIWINSYTFEVISVSSFTLKFQFYIRSCVSIAFSFTYGTLVAFMYVCPEDGKKRWRGKICEEIREKLKIVILFLNNTFNTSNYAYGSPSIWVVRAWVPG